MFTLSLTEIPASEPKSLYILRRECACLFVMGLEGWLKWEVMNDSLMPELRSFAEWDPMILHELESLPFEDLTVQRVWTEQGCEHEASVFVDDCNFHKLIQGMPFINSTTHNCASGVTQPLQQFEVSAGDKAVVVSVLKLTSSSMVLHIPRLQIDKVIAMRLLHQGVSFKHGSDGQCIVYYGNKRSLVRNMLSVIVKRIAAIVSRIWEYLSTKW